MRTVLILFSAVLLIAFADAQRKSNITKPVVNLQKRPRLPVSNRTPEERRKLSIFPKNTMKFMVTPKTVVKNDDTAKEGLPTKRPLMRKFTMQDRNDKGTWSFAPREPLMKTNISTFTLAPPESNQKESEESKEVISNAKIEQPSIQNHNLNKRHIIDTMLIKKMEPQASESIEKVENELNREEISQITKVNHARDFDIVRMNNNSGSKSDKVSKDYAIDILSLDDAVIILNPNYTKNESKNDHGSMKFNQAATFDTKLSKNLLESRAVDLKELKYAIEQNENNALTMNSEEKNNNNTAQILNFKDLEILLEKNVNNTEFSAADFNENNPTNSAKNETQVTLENIPNFDVTKPNQFYDVISLSSDKDKNTNFEQDFLAGHGAQIIENNEKPSVSETNILNGEEVFTENVSDSLAGGNLKSLINFMGKKTAGVEKYHQSNIVAHDAKEMKTYTNDEIISIMNDTGNEIQTEFPKKLNSNDTDSFNSKEILLEMYESNISLSSEELAADVVDETPNKNVNLSGLEILKESFIDSVSEDEISNESIRDTSKNYNKERSNESFVETLTGEEISNESSSIMTSEELSNECIFDECSIVEIPNETSNEEEISDESSLNSEEALTNRFKRSNNIIEEENLLTTVSGFKYTGNEITLNHDLSYKNINA